MNHTIPLTNDRYGEVLDAVMVAVNKGGKKITISDDDADRSAKQNRLAFLLYNAIEKQGYDKDARSYCKYHIGVPILIADDTDMMERFKAVFGSLSYETRIKAMEIVPVTSLMKVGQMTRYLEGIYNKFGEYQLPKPDDIYWEALGYVRPK